MKILHIISQRPDSTGSGYYVQNIIEQAALAGHENCLIYGTSPDARHEIKMVSEKNCYSVRFGEYPLDFDIPGMSDVMPYRSSRFKRLSEEQIRLYEKSFERLIFNVAREFQPDIVHSHHLWLASAAARRVLPERPIVTSCHSTDLRQFEQCSHLRKHVLTDCSNLDRVLSLSTNQADQIRSLYQIGQGDIDIVGTGFDANLFTLKGQPQKREKTRVELLYGGKLSFAKGVDLLIKSVLSLNNPNLHLHLAGSGYGEEAERCIALASSAPELISMHGRIKQPQLAKLMQQCDIFILPSFFEGLPLVLLEALACGCRIVTTALPGAVELLQDAPEDMVRFVPLPEMKSIDQPVDEERVTFENKVAEAITTLSRQVAAGRQLDTEEIEKRTAPFRWPAVFEKIAESYTRAIRQKAAIIS